MCTPARSCTYGATLSPSHTYTHTHALRAHTHCMLSHTPICTHPTRSHTPICMRMGTLSFVVPACRLVSVDGPVFVCVVFSRGFRHMCASRCSARLSCSPHTHALTHTLILTHTHTRMRAGRHACHLRLQRQDGEDLGRGRSGRTAGVRPRQTGAVPEVRCGGCCVCVCVCVFVLVILSGCCSIEPVLECAFAGCCACLC